MVLSLRQSSFHSLRLACEKVVSPAQTSIMPMVECSTVTGTWSCWPWSSSCSFRWSSYIFWAQTTKLLEVKDWDLELYSIVFGKSMNRAESRSDGLTVASIAEEYTAEFCIIGKTPRTDAFMPMYTALLSSRQEVLKTCITGPLRTCLEKSKEVKRLWSELSSTWYTPCFLGKRRPCFSSQCPKTRGGSWSPSTPKY